MSITGGLDQHEAELRRLIEERHQLAELEQHPGWQVLERYAREWLSTHERRLLSGHVDDLYEYKLLAGRAEGIRQVLEIGRTVANIAEAAENVSLPWQDEFVDDNFTAPTEEET